MAKTGLQWHQVRRVIKDAAYKHASSVPQKQVHSSMTEIFEMFGYDLWEALVEAYPEQFGELIISDYEAHLARQAAIAKAKGVSGNG